MQCWLTILLVAGVLTAGGSADGAVLETSRLISEVRCLDDPAHSYALYLPADFDPNREWPVIFAFSPFGNGSIPVKLLSEAAERYGYIVVGSNNSRNGQWEPIIEAQDALWRDVTARFPVDRQRCYATGFSGGARSALWFALDHPESIVGVIQCGAVFPRPREVPTDGRLALFGLVGDADLNITEHLEAQKLLDGKGVEHWQEIYPGLHQWPGEALYREAVEFMELAAMRRGLIPEDEAFIEALAEARFASAAALERSGQPLLALNKYRQTARCFDGLAAGEKARQAARDLGRQREIRRLKRLQDGYLAEVAMIKDWLDEKTFSRALERLRRRAVADGPFAAHARQALHLTSVRLTEMAMKLADQGQLEEAEAYCLIGIVAYPENPYAAFHAARYSARLGKPADAVQFLSAAAGRNFDRLDLVQGDPDLEQIRSHPGYHDIEQAIARNRDRGIHPLRYHYYLPTIRGDTSASGSPGEGFEVVHGLIPPNRG